MKVLSLFDGMACGMLAMQKAGIEVDRYVAYEIDKYAVQTSSHNFPMIEHKGDVFKADFTEYKGFDFLIGGSPCTYWSIAQKNNRETEASGMGWELFSQYVRALHEAKPRFFIYENNKSMSKAIRASIDEAFGFEAICINSALVSAQNRQRLYWVGKRNPDGTYRKVHVEQPEDRGILLKDVLDGFSDKEKSNPVLCSSARTTVREFFTKSQGGMAAEPVGIGYRGRMKKGKWVKRYESNEEPKANALTTCTHDSMVALRVEPKLTAPCKVGELGNGGQGNRIYSVNGKSVSQTAQGGGIGSNTGLYAIPVEFDGETPIKAVSYSDGKEYPVYEVVNGMIIIKGNRCAIKLQDGFYIFRKLTVAECKRLQTVPEWYEFPVSDAQAYKMLGNGWTVYVIVHLINSTQSEQVFEEQMDLFGVGV